MRQRRIYALSPLLFTYLKADQTVHNVSSPYIVVRATWLKISYKYVILYILDRLFRSRLPNFYYWHSFNKKFDM